MAGKIADEFRARKIGPVAGGIDGTYFAMQKQADDALHNDYIDRKGFASFAFQAVVGADGLLKILGVSLDSSNESLFLLIK